MTYNFVVCTAGVVGPCGLLHHAAGNGLKVHQVVASRQGRHALDALLARLLLGIGSLLLLFDSGHVNFTEMHGRIEVFVEGVGRVDGVELLGRILAGILEDDLLATRVLWIMSVTEIYSSGEDYIHTWQKFGHIVGFSMDNDPARVLGVVFGDSSACELAFTHSGVVGWDEGDWRGRRLRREEEKGWKQELQKEGEELRCILRKRRIARERKKERE